MVHINVPPAAESATPQRGEPPVELGDVGSDAVLEGEKERRSAAARTGEEGNRARCAATLAIAAAIAACATVSGDAGYNASTSNAACATRPGLGGLACCGSGSGRGGVSARAVTRCCIYQESPTT